MNCQLIGKVTINMNNNNRHVPTDVKCPFLYKRRLRRLRLERKMHSNWLKAIVGFWVVDLFSTWKRIQLHQSITLNENFELFSFGWYCLPCSSLPNMTISTKRSAKKIIHQRSPTGLIVSSWTCKKWKVSNKMCIKFLIKLNWNYSLMIIFLPEHVAAFPRRILPRPKCL